MSGPYETNRGAEGVGPGMPGPPERAPHLRRVVDLAGAGYSPPGCAPLRGLAAAAFVEAEQLRWRGLVLEVSLDAVERPFDPVEAAIHSAPARCDELDEECEVLDAGTPLGLEELLEPLEPADPLGGQAANLGEIARDGHNLRAESLLQGARELLGHRSLELRRRLREGLELLARPPERRLESKFVVASGLQRDEPPSGPFQDVVVHLADCTVRSG